MSGPMMKRGGNLAILIGEPHHGMPEHDGADQRDEDDEDEHEGARKDIAGALIDAVHSKDHEGVIQALDAWTDLHGVKRGEKDEDGDDPDCPPGMARAGSY